MLSRKTVEGPSVAFRDETDIISQVGRRLTTQCLTHQTGEFVYTALLLSLSLVRVNRLSNLGHIIYVKINAVYRLNYAKCLNLSL